MGSVKTWLAAAALCAAAASTWASGAQDLLSTLDRAAQPAPEPSVTVRLVAQNEGLTPQAENLLAVVLEHAPGWHTYWRMPGDAGLTTQFSFTTPKDVRLTDPRFPLPERHNDKGIVSFSYGGTAVFPLRPRSPASPRDAPRASASTSPTSPARTSASPARARPKSRCPTRSRRSPRPMPSSFRTPSSTCPKWPTSAACAPSTRRTASR